MAPDSTVMMQTKHSANRLHYLWRALVVCLSLIPIVSASAYAEVSCPPTQTNQIYTLNGILTKPEDAYDNMLNLKNLVKPQLSAEENAATKFNYIVNDTQGFDDFLESLLQTGGLESSRYYLALAGLEAFPADSLQNLLQNINNNNAIQSIIGGNSLDPITLARVMEAPREAILHGRRVVVVTHSQGNFYSNSAAALPSFLTPTQRLSYGTVNVAVPDSRVQTNVTESTTAKTEYTTLIDDEVITFLAAGVRAALLLPPPLPWTTDDGYVNPFARMLNHSFTAAYLANDPSRSKIVQATLDTMRSLVIPSCESIKFTSVSCSVSSLNSSPALLWQMAGTASTLHPSAVVQAVPNPSYGISGSGTVVVSSCTAWTSTAPYYNQLYCSKSPTDPSSTNWSAALLSPMGTSEVRAELTDGATWPSQVGNLGTDQKTGLSCPGNFQY